MSDNTKMPLALLRTGLGTSFYNTINLSGESLQKAHKANKSQENKILCLLESNQKLNFTKYEIKMILVGKGLLNANTPETSINRALTNLKKAGFVIMYPEQRMGGLGRLNHEWGIVTGNKSSTQVQLTLFSHD
jgi:hypothetical protein